jgi:hypothetical protein
MTLDGFIASLIRFIKTMVLVYPTLSGMALLHIAAAIITYRKIGIIYG